MFRAGDPGRTMYFINSGSVVVIVNNRRVDSFEKRDYFGEVGMVLGEKSSATISAMESTELLQLDVDAFYELSSDVPEFPIALKHGLLENGTPNKRVGQAVSIMAKLAHADRHPKALSPRLRVSGETPTEKGRRGREEWEVEMCVKDNGFPWPPPGLLGIFRCVNPRCQLLESSAGLLVDPNKRSL